MKSALRATLLTFVLVLAPAATAVAASFDVSSTGDDGAVPGTLRFALLHAGPGDSIGFSTGGPIAPASPLPAVDSGVDVEGCSVNPNAAGPCVAITGSSAFDGLDVTGAGAIVRGLAITGAGVGIRVTGSNASIGGPSAASANTISGSAAGAIVVANPASGVVLNINTGHGNAGRFIQLAGGANGGIGPPALIAVSDSGVAGTAAPGALVRLFAASSAGSVDGFAAAATADKTGIWLMHASSTAGEAVAATQTGQSGTSQLTDVVVTSRASPARGAAPTATIAGPTGVTTDTSPAFTLTASDPGAALVCHLDSAAYAPCRSSYSPPIPLPDGPHTLYARAIGAAGDLGPEVSQAFEVNAATPATIVSGPPRYSNRSSATFRFTWPGGAKTVECNLDNKPYASCRSPFATGYLLDGRHTFRVRVTDAAGEAAVVEQVFTIDTLSPWIGLGPRRVRVNSNAAVAVLASCPASEPAGCSGRVGLSTVPVGKHEHPRVLGAADWTGAPRTVTQVLVPVPPWAVALARSRKGLRVLAVLRARDKAGNVTRIGMVVLVLPPVGGGGSGGSGGGGIPHHGSTRPRRIA
jgi:hypothetical protein